MNEERSGNFNMWMWSQLAGGIGKRDTKKTS